MKEENGFVVLTAIVVMVFMLTVGLAIAKVVDGQAKQSREERVRESAFNAAEGLLYAQAAVLQSNWPTDRRCSGNADGCGYALQTGNPVAGLVARPSCSSATLATNPSNQCPDPARIFGTNAAGTSNGSTGAFNNPDIIGNSANVKWTIQVRDDPGGDTLSNPIYYKGTATTPAPGGVDRTDLGCVDAANAPAICTYDKNKDNRMWVRVDVDVRGKTRSLVALLQLEKFSLPLTAAAVVGNRVKMTNGGNNAVVNTNGSQIITRCTPSPRSTTTQPLSPGALTVTVAGGSGFSSITGKQVAIDTGLNWEVADLASVSGNTLTFATNGQRHGPQKAHASGVRIEFAPKQGSSGNPCAGWDPAQITPPQSYVSIPGFQDGLTPSALAGMIKTATAVYPDTGGNPCPSNANSGIAWYGQIVIKGPADCVMNPNNSGGGVANINPTAPGAVVVLNGTLSIQGNTNYNGVIYIVNGQHSSGTVLTLASTVTVKGGVIVDGEGSIDLGQGTNTVVFDPDAFHHFQAGGAAGLVQNSWRELSHDQ